MMRKKLIRMQTKLLYLEFECLPHTSSNSASIYWGFHCAVI